jgi:hypothetical protein
MKEFQMRVKRLRRSKSGCEDCGVTASAASQHAHLFHRYSPRENRAIDLSKRMSRCLHTQFWIANAGA